MLICKYDFTLTFYRRQVTIKLLVRCFLTKNMASRIANKKNVCLALICLIYSCHQIFLNFIRSDASSTSESGSGSPLPENLLPITKIPNTNLFTGIFYKLILKSLPQGLVTWAWSNDNFFAQYELNPTELPKYVAGGEYQFDHQWAFSATESNNGYKLSNRGLQKGYLIRSDVEVGSGRHVTYYDDQASKGDEWDKDASWIVQPTCDQNYYKIENLGSRSNFLSWTWTKHNDFNYYIQVAQDFDEDSKFSFEPIGINLDATIYDFEFRQGLESFLNNNGSDYRQEFMQSNSNPSNSQIVATIEKTVQSKDSITVSFEQSMSLISKTTISISLLESIGVKQISFQGGFEANVDQKTDFTKSSFIRQQFVIPPRKTLDVGIFSVWASNVELKFSAKMKIVGRTDRMVQDCSNVTQDGPVPSEFIEEFINSSKCEKLEIISRSDADITVLVSGVLKGNFALRNVLRGSEKGKLRVCN